ncbi:hypothetical protein INF28_10460 [Oscillospiraceae bacterium DSM 107454]|uniref:SLH domain-containing protein n=2 Tax=Ructibacterium gallinarum TaxID=2779355 RepID=A0A9D5M2E3_9FIRM|nr:hypothetical protein [Ructibacterium gallinarum]
MKRYWNIVFILLYVLSTNLFSVYAETNTGNNANQFIASERAVKLITDLEIMKSLNMDEIATYEDLEYAIGKITNYSQIGEKYFKSYKITEPVNYAETIMVLLDIIGYTPVIGIDGYSVDKCMNTAREIDLTSGISLQKDDNITIGQLCELIYRALNTDIIKEIGASEDGITYAKNEGQTLLTDKFQLEKIRGIVEETALSSLLQVSRKDKGMITINSQSYQCDLEKYEDYIGLYVEAYVSSDDRTVKSIFADDNDNIVITIDADDISNSSTKNKIVYYNEKGKQKNISLDSNVSVIYNGSLYQDYTSVDFKPEEGTLYLIDNNKNGVYDVVRIEEYKSIVVAGVSINSCIMREKGNNDTIDISNIIDGYGILVDANGSNISIDKIGANTVVSYAQNKNNEVYKMVLSEKKISGYINVINENESIRLGDTEYEGTKTFWENLQNFGAGDLVWAYINFQDKIVEIDKETSLYKYGYLMDFVSELFCVRVKIFTSAGTIETFETTEDININGQKMTAQTAFDQNRRNSPFWNEAGKIPQLIKYRLREGKYVSNIETAINEEEKISDNNLVLNISGNRKWFGNAQAIDPMVRLNQNTMVFSIPFDESDEWDYKVQGYADIGLATDTTYTCKIYDVDDDCYAKAVVIKRNTSLPSVDRVYPLYLITSVGHAINDRGENVIFFEYVDSKGNSDYIIAEEQDLSVGQMFPVSLSDIKVGAVIQVARNTTRSELANFICYANPDDNQNQHMYEYCYSNWGFSLSKTAFYSDNKLISFGEVRGLVKDGMIINNTPQKDDSGNILTDGSGNVIFDEEYNRLVSFPSTGVPVKLYDSSNELVYDASIADIQAGDKVLVDQTGGTVEWIILYR